MNYDRTKPLTKRNVIDFLRSLDIEVKTNTKARGNQGLYQKNRIDISKNLDDDKAISVLVHEFSHHIHSQIDKDFIKNGGSIQTIFKTYEVEEIKSELINVTKLIDKNSRLTIFLKAKEEISSSIKSMQSAIKRDYPQFLRSKKFVEFEKYIKNSEAKYLVKYDAIRLMQGFFFKKERILTVKNLENDFPDMPKPFQIYIKLCSMQRKQSKVTRRINKLNKYYEKPTELFARFVQGYFMTPETIETVAPKTTKRFKELLKEGYYKELKDLFEIFKGF
jgi:predicted nucleic acid-binding protein